MRRSAYGLVLLVALALCAAPPAEARHRHRRGARAAVADTTRTTACDRICLNAFLDRYVEALIAHDPSRTELAPDFRATENGVVVAPGAGLWRSVEDIGDYRIRAIDVGAGQAALLGVFQLRAGGAAASAGGDPPAPGAATAAPRALQFVLRLKIVKRQISEAELVLARDVPPEFRQAAARLGLARRAFGDRVDPDSRLPRAQLTAAANAYYDGIEHGSAAGVPFAADCQRIGNGIAMVNNREYHSTLVSPDGRTPPEFAAMGCREQFDSGIWSTATVTARRFPVVDEERGLVVAFTQYNAYARGRCADVRNFGQVCAPEGVAPSSLDLVEFFRVRDGQIHEMESVWSVLPAGAGTGW